jgi:hypothetical protein
MGKCPRTRQSDQCLVLKVEQVKVRKYLKQNPKFHDLPDEHLKTIIAPKETCEKVRVY